MKKQRRGLDRHNVSVKSILLGASNDFAQTSPSVPIVVVVVLGLYVPPTAKVIRRRDLGLKYYIKFNSKGI